MAEKNDGKTTIIGGLKTRFTDALKNVSQDTRRKAYAAYQAMAKIVAKNVPGNTLMDENRDRLVVRLYPKHLGRIIMFFYDPKHKDTLPYYDRFPLVIPIQFMEGGFLGLNLHYLPQAHRARLMDALYANIYMDKYINERKQIQISYTILQNAIKTNLYKPCIKHYLNGHVRSKFYIVKPEDWQIVTFLPTERFEKQNKVVVYADSLRKVRGF